MATTRVNGIQIADGTITDTKIATSNKDGLANVFSMRTLGTTSTSACAGNDARLSGVSLGIIILEDRKANGTPGGTFTSGAWNARDLNTEVLDTNNLCSFVSGGPIFTLLTGTYELEATCPAYGVEYHQCRVWNNTDSTTIALGSSMYASLAGGNNNTSRVFCRFTLASSKNLLIQHRCSQTDTTFGNGIACSFGVGEVYTQVKIIRVA